MAFGSAGATALLRLSITTARSRAGEVHDMLFAQFTNGEMIPDWEESSQPADLFSQTRQAAGLVEAGHVYQDHAGR